MLVMDFYCGVTCKIIDFPSGNDIPTRSRELIQHFNEIGTPIMIGGGVLAYTLLGIQYNEETGESRYLILDPHYTGQDDPKTILGKGWCAWKPPSVFKSNAHYNFCVPVPPTYF